MSPRQCQCCGFFLAAALLVASAPASRGGQGPISLAITCPTEGAAYKGRVDFAGSFTGRADGQLTILIKCFGVTHHHRMPSYAAAMLAQGGQMRFDDPHFACAPGQQTAIFSVWQQDRPAPLAEARVSFAIEKPDTIEGQPLERLRQGLISGGMGIVQAENYVRSTTHLMLDGRGSAERVAEARDGIPRALAQEFRARVGAMLGVAELHEWAMDPAKALRALQVAEDIYRQDAGRFITPRVETAADGPVHLAAYARYYTRQGDYAKAATHWRQTIAWHETSLRRGDLAAAIRHERRQALRRAYEGLGNLHILLKNDVDAYEACQAEIRKLQPQGR